MQAGKFPEINKCAGWNLSRIYCEKTMQAGKISEINKRAGCNKAVQDVIFQESIVKKPCRLQNTQKFRKFTQPTRLLHPARLLDRLEYPGKHTVQN